MRVPPGFGRNVVSNASTSALHSVTQLGLLLVLIQIFDDASYAAFLTATFMIGLLEMTSDYGVRVWATREFAISEVPASVLSRSVRCKIVCTVLSGAVFCLIPLKSLTASGLLLSVLVAGTQPSTDPLLWYLRGRTRLDVEAGVVLVFRVIIVAAMLLAARLGQGLDSLLLVWLAFNILRIVTEYRLEAMKPLVLDTASAASGPLLSASATLRHAFPIGTALVLASVFQRASVLLLDVFSTAQDVKIYGTAFKIVTASGFVSTGVFVSSFALLTRAVESRELGSIRSVVRRQFVLVTLVFVPMCAIGTLFAVPTASWFSSGDMSRIANVVVWLMPGLYLSSVNMGLKYMLNAYQLNWQDVGVVGLGLCVMVCATMFHGALTWTGAAALGWGLGEATLLLARLGLLWSRGQPSGVPVAVILGSAASLVLMLIVSDWAQW